MAGRREFAAWGVHRPRVAAGEDPFHDDRVAIGERADDLVARGAQGAEEGLVEVRNSLKLLSVPIGLTVSTSGSNSASSASRS